MDRLLPYDFNMERNNDFILQMYNSIYFSSRWRGIHPIQSQIYLVLKMSFFVFAIFQGWRARENTIFQQRPAMKENLRMECFTGKELCFFRTVANTMPTGKMELPST